MFWFFGWLLVLLVTSSTVMETDAGEPSVYLFHSPKGNFFMAPRMSINSSDAQHILTKNVTNCTCKSACFAVSCKAWSVVKLNDSKVECRLANKGPLEVIPVEDTDAFYFFREDSIAGTYSFHKEDNLLYVELNLKMWFNIGKKTCRQIPGHRMMIVKTEVQYRYFKSLWDTHKSYRVAVDMKKIMIGSTKQHVLGDGTLYNETELQQEYIEDNSIPQWDIYINIYGKFDDRFGKSAYTIICQANPLGVEW